MANLHKWVGQNVTFTFGSTNGTKAKNNSGIGYVVLYPEGGASSSENRIPIFNNFDYMATYVDGGTYYGYSGVGNHNGIYQIGDVFWTLSNSEPGNTNPSVTTQRVSDECTGGVKFYTGLVFNGYTNAYGYNNVPYIDNELYTVYSYTPATALKITPSKKEFYNDDTTVTLNVSPVGATSSRSNLKTPVINVTSNETGIIDSPGTSTTNTSTNLRFINTTYIPGSAQVKLTATHTGGVASSTSNLSSSQISGSTTITVRNAVSKIKFDETVKYISVGETNDLLFSVIPVAPGIPYSYDTAFISDSEYFTYNPTQAAAADVKGVVKITGAKVGAGLLTIASEYCANATVSNTITIYVTPADTSVYINTGDVYSLTVGEGGSISNIDNNGSNSYVIASINRDVLIVRAIKATPLNTPVKITLRGGAVISVTVTNLDITLA